VSGRSNLDVLTSENFGQKKLLPACLMIILLFSLDASGCDRLRIVEKQTHDPASDTYTYKYKNLPEWAEYGLGAVVGAV